MKLLLAGCLTALSLAIAAPAGAATIYVGPGGVGVGPGYHPYRARGAYEGRRPIFEGRSAFHPYRRDFRRF